MSENEDTLVKTKSGDNDQSLDILKILLDPTKRVRFEQDVMQNLDILYTEAICLTHDTVDAEALVQKTLLVAFSRYEYYKNDIPVDEWLLMIMERTFRAN
ncbi:MAG TPA: hypothetical protein PLP19_21075 [bacterium]|nr:hypothetical protein [bacterium]HPN45990.1 hypothetical protein [bacterium]